MTDKTELCRCAAEVAVDGDDVSVALRCVCVAVELIHSRARRLVQEGLAEVVGSDFGASSTAAPRRCRSGRRYTR